VKEYDLYSELDRDTFFLKPRQILRTLKSKRLILITFFIGFLTAGNLYYLFFHSDFWTAQIHLKAVNTQQPSKQINILAADVITADILNQVLANIITKNLRLSAIVPKPRIFEIIGWLKSEKPNGIDWLMKDVVWQELLTYLRATITPKVDSNNQQLVIEVRTRNADLSKAIAAFMGHAISQYHYLNQKSKIQEVESFITSKIDRVNQQILETQSALAKEIKLKLKNQLLLELEKQRKALVALTFDTQIVREPFLVDDYVRPTVITKVFIVALMGLILTLLALLFKTILFYRVRFLSDFEQIGLIPSAEIPRIEVSDPTLTPLLLDYSDDGFHKPFNELFSSLTKKFEPRRKKYERGQILLVTGPVISSGKSFVAANLACKFSEKGFRVLLIDCDFRLPTLDKIFDFPKSTLGIEQLIKTDSLSDDLKHTVSQNLHVVTCQSDLRDPSILLDSHRLKSALRTQRQNYDYILLDSSPTLAAGDASVLATFCNGAIMVTGYKQCFLEEVEHAFADLQMVKKIPVYAVINYSEQVGKLGLKSGPSSFHKSQKIR